MIDNQTIKPSTTLLNGIMIGVGIALIGAGLVVAFSLNALYIQQTNYLASTGIQVHTYTYGFDDLIFMISTGALMAMLGTFELVMGCLNQFSAKARGALSAKDAIVRVGNGLITGGFLGASLFCANLIRQQYLKSSSSWYEPVLTAFIAGGLIAIAIVAFLIRRSYLQSQRATKV